MKNREAGRHLTVFSFPARPRRARFQILLSQNRFHSDRNGEQRSCVAVCRFFSPQLRQRRCSKTLLFVTSRRKQRFRCFSVLELVWGFKLKLNFNLDRMLKCSDSALRHDLRPEASNSNTINLILNHESLKSRTKIGILKCNPNLVFSI